MSRVVDAPPEPPLPSASPPAEAALPAARARDLVTRLARAVQRATIYPPGHPSIRLATTPLVEGLRALGVPEVLIGFTSDRVFVGTDPRDARPFDLPWMSARLSGRGLSSIRLEARIAPNEAGRLVEWLAQGDDLLAASALPSFEGALISKVDFAAVRFREASLDDAGAGTPADLAWRAVSQMLVGDIASGLRDLAGVVDPAELARAVRDAIERHEGTGVGDLGARLVAAGAQLAGLPADVQAAVKGRLAAFVAALSPELRGHLLTVAPTDDPAKLALLGEIVDRLPSAAVLEVIRHAQFEAGTSSQQLVSFLVKLAGVAATEPALAEAFDERCRAAGLPGDLAYADGARLHDVLEGLLERRADVAVAIAPHDYQQRLDQISTSVVPARPARADARHVAPEDEAGVQRQTGRIALHLLQAGGMDPADQLTCLDRLEQGLSACVEGWHADLLASIAEVAGRLARTRGGPQEVRDKARILASSFERPEFLEAVIDRLARVEEEPPPALSGLARAGGAPLAAALLERVGRCEDHADRDRLARGLAWLDPDVVREAVTTAYEGSPRAGRALLAALSAAGASSPVAEAAFLFLGDADAALRLEAFRLLFAAHLSTSRFEALVRHALDDPEPRLVHLGIEEAARRARAGLRPLAGFVEQRSTAAIAAAQRHAVRVVAAMGTREARERLRGAIALRRARFDQASRATALAIADALGASDDPLDVAAVRAWRRSPAGWAARWLGGGRLA